MSRKGKYMLVSSSTSSNGHSPMNSPNSSVIDTDLPLYENVEEPRSLGETPPPPPRHGSKILDEIMAGRSPVITCNLDSPSSTSRLKFDEPLAIDRISSQQSSFKRQQRRIEMRPLSIPPPELAKGGSSSSGDDICGQKCFIGLGIATLGVFALAFAIYFLYDDIAQLFSKMSRPVENV